MPLGLLCYETILNALEHAWPEGQAGKLVVELQAKDPTPEVRISDDGVGFVASGVTKGLGTQLTRALALEAQVEVETHTTVGSGTTVVMRLAG
jgi:two-component sensor histidine kinase